MNRASWPPHRIVTCRHQREAINTSARHTPATLSSQPNNNTHTQGTHNTPHTHFRTTNTPLHDGSLSQSLMSNNNIQLPSFPCRKLKPNNTQQEIEAAFSSFFPFPKSLLMAHAVAWRPCSRLARTSDVWCSGREFRSGKRVHQSVWRSRVGSGAIRSSASEASTGFQGRYASFDQSGCEWSCPVNRDSNVQRWVEDSVHEIVRNIQEAPFLQYVFDSKGSLGRSRRQKISEDALKDANSWSPIRDSLSTVDPDAVILVQRMEPSGSRRSSACCLPEALQFANDEEGDEEREERVCHVLQAEGAETNVWGVLVQARGVHTNACYLLKTTRVSSSAGTCTRYCLTRAQCCGASPIDQLENAWLL